MPTAIQISQCTQTPRNHFIFTIDAAISLVKITEIKVLYCSGELVEKIVQ